MSRYSGPRLRLFKRLGPLPGFGNNMYQKYQKYKNVHRQDFVFKKKKKQKNQAYFLRLIEKQKLRYHYGLTEKNLAKYVRTAQKQKKSTGEILLKNLEMRLDNIVFRCGFTSTLPAARQLITHGHIFLNGQKRTRPSISCQPEDSITLHKKIHIHKKIQTSPYGKNGKKRPSPFFSFDVKNNSAKVHRSIERRDVHLPVQELFVVEYYSRRNG
uniref:Small ribosomal subunit protein uS4c n=1 Tax=Boodleopsis pusilla TaxID=381415 RepID=A0A386AZG6_9CHLO|nr:ribosomal protein S4 [Boodleopsis pusilla]AYC64840.1 ribosomal protein S4 [Boodleopsis pusilla]